ncbi:lysozyme-like [Chrysoperla carnea]|uniref:lysozyme-like n=1 Tax=Chrysoperla carnea TaxID=189513 RepID=UPI001D08E7A8|nr:lysozyme-like [Chrysoperla carnea]
MKYVILLVTIIIVSNNNLANGKTFKNECELAKELLKHGFPKNQLNDWTCLVLSESSGDTKKTHKNNNGSTDYGLFQINDRYWCAHGKNGKDCNVNCNDLLKDDITLAAKCAKKVYDRHGFEAWYGWKNKCKNGKAKSVQHCFN